MLTLDKHRLESSCSGLIGSLWYMYKEHKSDDPYFLSLCKSGTIEGTTSCPTPNGTLASPQVPVGSNKEGGQGKGRAWSSIGERRWHRKQSRRQMDQQMVSFRCIPEDDRAAGHMQRESEWKGQAEEQRQTERIEGRDWRAFPFLFPHAAPPCVPS